MTDPRDRDYAALPLLLAIIALGAAACSWAHQLGLRDRLGVLTVRVEAIEAEHFVEREMRVAHDASVASSVVHRGPGYGVACSAPTTYYVYPLAAGRAIAQGRRDLAGAEREVKR